MGFRCVAVRLSLALLLATVAAAPASAANPRITAPALAFPSFINTSDDIIVAKGFDKSHGLTYQPVLYGTSGAQWAGVAKGELLSGVISPYQLTKMRRQGIDIAIYGTFLDMSVIAVLTKHADIKNFADLKGRSFAAQVGFANFEYFEMYAKRLGFNLRTDVHLVDATTAMAQAQLEADRVDAILAWEPELSLILKRLPQVHIVVTGDQAWSHITGNRGWDAFLFVNRGWVKKNPGALPRLIAMYQTYGRFIADHPEEADAIVASNKYSSKNIPAGTIAAAIKSKRFVADVRPSWDPDTNRQIWQMLQLGLDDGYIDAMPDRDAVYNERPAD